MSGEVGGFCMRDPQYHESRQLRLAWDLRNLRQDLVHVGIGGDVEIRGHPQRSVARVDRVDVIHVVDAAISCSSGVATDCSRVWASAPGKVECT